VSSAGIADHFVGVVQFAVQPYQVQPTVHQDLRCQAAGGIEFQQCGRVADCDTLKSLAVQRASAKSHYFVNERARFRIEGCPTLKPRKNVFRKRPKRFSSECALTPHCAQ
jgi:hypothetical protein